LPCRDISNRDYQSSSTSKSQGSVYNTDNSKRGEITDKSSSASVQYFGQSESQKGGRQRARRSLHYDDNENIIDDATTEYVLSRKRQISPESSVSEQPRKRCRTEGEACMLESMRDEDLPTESERRSSRKLSSVFNRNSGQWTPTTRERTLTPHKDGMTLVDTPSKSVTFHDSVVGGDGDDVIETQSSKQAPRSGRRSRTSSFTQKDESPVWGSPSGGKGTPRSGRRNQRLSSTQTDESSVQGTPRARRSILSTPKSSQKGTPRTLDAMSAAETPQRSSARIADSPLQPASGRRRGNRATPRTSDKKQKDFPVRRLLSASSPGTGRVLRPRTPISYKFLAAVKDADDLYDPDVELSDEEELAVKRTPVRKGRKEVHKLITCASLFMSTRHFLGYVAYKV